LATLEMNLPTKNKGKLGTTKQSIHWAFIIIPIILFTLLEPSIILQQEYDITHLKLTRKIIIIIIINFLKKQNKKSTNQQQAG